ncbi:transglutaminase-like putative cysteine protease [Pullulanibacillus pueri]|uniref:Transglutaminase-like domain-containing protein n=1 Tax=Pullulanibacillus pueri TaxID=1437324 RepID=A0A8J3EL58_9BACL|nr:transglutaminase family protein [Pullulanibacillus pueri]MBM7681150.1 transglutaminase-like putative cysteine protease [Pullulanibacillus pueri]GGH77241.1 hypothetical protein GCM10007096_08850 [Pullulanibacillus pueri]
MEFVIESIKLEDYLKETPEVNYFHPLIQDKVRRFFNPYQTDIEKARKAFEYVRDDIAHSYDIQGTIVTAKASDVLLHKQGICYAKAMLLAALLRSQGIPTGFCYQRLMLFDVPEKGYCIHALNAVYLKELQHWVRLDARGNKPGVNAQFSLNDEQLAFRVNEAVDEKDYNVIYCHPHPKTVAVLKAHSDAQEMYRYHLPQEI